MSLLSESPNRGISNPRREYEAVSEISWESASTMLREEVVRS